MKSHEILSRDQGLKWTQLLEFCFCRILLGYPAVFCDTFLSKKLLGIKEKCHKTFFSRRDLLRFHPSFLEFSKIVSQKTAGYPREILENRILRVESPWGLLPLERLHLSFLSFFFLKMLSKGQQGTLRKFKKTKFLEVSPLEALLEARGHGLKKRSDPWLLVFWKLKCISKDSGGS